MKSFAIVMLLAVFMAVNIQPVAAQQAQNSILIEGHILDAESGEPASGTTLQIRSIRRGTFASGSGHFRMSIPKGLQGSQYTLMASGIGYEADSINVSAEKSSTNIIFRLSQKTKGMLTDSVIVLAEITPRSLVRMAIDRLMIQRGRMNTMTGSIYKKALVNTEADMIGISERQRERIRNSITESFEKIYYRNTPTPLQHTVLEFKKQSANVSPDRTVPMLDQLYDLTQDELQFVTTHLTLPLSRRGLDKYDFTLKGVETYHNDSVYVISFTPASMLTPGFTGIMRFSKDDHTMRMIDMQISSGARIPYFDNVHIYQEFTPVIDMRGNKYWLPEKQTTYSEANVELVKWLAEFGCKVSVNTTITDRSVNNELSAKAFVPGTFIQSANSPLPDSTLAYTIERTANEWYTIMPSAYKGMKNQELEWTDDDRFRLSSADSAIYARGDSLSAMLTRSEQAREGIFNTITNFNLSPTATLWLNPVWNKTRVTGYLYGADATLFLHNTSYNLNAATGPDGQSTLGFSVKHDLERNYNSLITLFGYGFSRMATVQEQPVISRWLAVIAGGVNITNILYSDFVDFYRETGFTAGISGRKGLWDFGIAPRWSRQEPGQTKLEGERTNIQANAGDFFTVQSELAWNFPFITVSFPIAGEKTMVGFRMTGLYGREFTNGYSFGRSDLSLRLVQPTFKSGYTPMYLAINTTIGMATDNTPIQYRFVLQRRYPFMGLYSDFSTSAINRYGGTRFVTIQAEHGFSDILWRWLGLPVFQGRGIELIARAATTRYDLTGQPPPAPGMLTETGGWYSEIGFGVSRIPTFLSDAIYGRIDAMWGIGNLAKGNFAVNYAVSVPLELLSLIGILQQ
jgi:hypothetical protein